MEWRLHMKVTVKVTKKQIYILAIFSIIIFIFFLSISILHSKGLYTVQYSGFGIDSHGTLYVGTDLGIKKYQNDIESGNINPQTSRGYSFTMQNNDTILLSVSDEFITMDLDGNVLSRKDYNGDYNLKSEIEKVADLSKIKRAHPIMLSIHFLELQYTIKMMK